nr:hypothetical protein [Opitutaceae bacterium]
MKKSALTIGQRITLGFSFVILLACALGIIAAWNMLRAVSGATFLDQAVVPQAVVTSDLSLASAEVQLAARSYSFTGEEANYDTAAAGLEKVRAELQNAKKLVTAQPALEALAQGVRDSDAALAEYEKQFTATHDSIVELQKLQSTLDAQGARFLTEISNYIKSQEVALADEISQKAPAEKLQERLEKITNGALVRNEGNQIRLAAQRAQAQRDVEVLKAALPRFQTMETLRADLLANTRQASNIKQLEEVSAAARAYKDAITALSLNLAQSEEIGRARAAAGAKFDEVVNSLLKRSIERTRDYADQSQISLSTATNRVILGLCLMVAGGVVSAWLIIRGVNKVLTHTAENLTQGALQVASASGQVSSASQSLAEGSSEQAASLEEISSSIEELASMTKRNADNAQ